MADEIIGRISVGDGATFTPSVDSDGVISWTNNKNLPNPESVDIPQAVVDRYQLAPTSNPTFTGTVTAEDITASGTITGDLTGNVTGNVTGTASGNLPLSGGTVTGDLTVDGTITGDVTGTASGNLPLSGGTMTGGITTSATDFIVKGNNTTHLTIAGGSAYSNSASLRLAGGEETGQTGLWQLRSQDGVNSKDLIGKPGGELTWGGSNVAVMGTLQNGHGILTGSVSNISVNGNSYATGTVDFGQTFASAPTVVACAGTGHKGIIIGTNNMTTTGFSYIVTNEDSTTRTNEAFNWIAIG